MVAPSGYLIDRGVRTIRLEAGKNAEFVFVNSRKPSLTVIKYDANLKRNLPGAAFKITKIADASHYLDRITDELGCITVGQLEPGIYSVVETAAPVGYIRNATEYHVELFPGQDSTLVVNNVKKPDLRILKLDEDTKKPLENATFKVRKVDSSTVSTVKTDANGEDQAA